MVGGGHAAVQQQHQNNNSIFISSGAAPESNQAGLLADVHSQIEKQSVSLN